ncbi:Uncharacterized protein FWK35_00004349 [Aphis craccivora]|uniref:Uncharacterized protein n=1 Tax=Aphis craccivora TaxID=307492 RepID=A0A6G0ZGM9_APHCR|nr:Uncharacterized protein FWK35_00004349 [Aphis craccivora]
MSFFLSRVLVHQGGYLPMIPGRRPGWPKIAFPPTWRSVFAFHSARRRPTWQPPSEQQPWTRKSPRVTWWTHKGGLCPSQIRTINTGSDPGLKPRLLSKTSLGI